MISGMCLASRLDLGILHGLGVLFGKIMLMSNGTYLQVYIHMFLVYSNILFACRHFQD
jgi:hypothetical protein